MLTWRNINEYTHDKQNIDYGGLFERDCDHYNTGSGIHYIEWAKTHNEPQVIVSGIKNPRISGIVDVIDWLKELPAGVTFWIDTFS